MSDRRHFYQFANVFRILRGEIAAPARRDGRYKGWEGLGGAVLKGLTPGGLSYRTRTATRDLDYAVIGF